MTNPPIVLGSRGSDLALWQANYVKSQLEHLGYSVKLEIIVTKGDRIQDLSFDKLEGKGFFTKEIEDALISGKIDLAVHSLKDLPTTSPEGLTIAALSYREDPRDVLIINEKAYDPKYNYGLKKGAVVGTSSSRRKSQIQALLGDVVIKDLRGNVPTRVRKCLLQEYDAILLAAAGLERLKLDLSGLIKLPLPPQIFVPAPAQGVLGLQVRADDGKMLQLLTKIHNKDTEETVGIERELLAAFEGGCQMPLGIYCRKNDSKELELHIAKAPTAEKLPAYIKIIHKSRSEIIDQGFKKASNIEPKSVLVTSEKERFSTLDRILTSWNFTAHYVKFIQTEVSENAPNELPEFDWVFFPSREAVRYFFQLYPRQLKNSQIAALGEGTANSLRELGVQVSYVGESNNLKEVANLFELHLEKNAKILYPHSRESKNTLQNAWIASDKVELLPIELYLTNINSGISVPETDIVFFTSPSNVTGWINNGGNPNQVIAIAMGNTTFIELQRHPFKRIEISSGFDQIAISASIFSV